MTAPGLEFAFEASFAVGDPVELGGGPHGTRRVVPITGGTFAGPAIEGVVVRGGAAWLNRSIFVGTGERHRNRVNLQFWRVV